MHVVVGSDETGLDGRSTVLTEQIQTVDQSRLGSRTGMLLSPTMHEVDRAIHFSLGLMGCPIRRG
jgi:mRNA-degrading endonuclease toxin of MazEF toxin-antitoxin module